MRCTGYEMARYKGTQASHLYEKSMHTLCTIQWATAPGRSLNYPRPKSITHLRTFSDNGVYVALQLFLVILVSDQWRRVLIPYSYRQAPWGLLHARGWLSRYTWDQQLYVVSEPRETHSPMLKARFLHLTNLVAQPGIEPPTFEGTAASCANRNPHFLLSSTDLLVTYLMSISGMYLYITIAMYQSWVYPIHSHVICQCHSLKWHRHN